MIKKKVWTKVSAQQIPKGKKCVKSKWVFNLKQDGTFKARLVACEYTQVPGIDFNESYSPVINDVTWRVLLVEMITKELDAKIVDVETAFLYGDLPEEVYMVCKELHEKDEALHLNKSIYGLV